MGTFLYRLCGRDFQESHVACELLPLPDVVIFLVEICLYCIWRYVLTRSPSVGDTKGFTALFSERLPFPPRLLGCPVNPVRSSALGGLQHLGLAWWLPRRGPPRVSTCHALFNFQHCFAFGWLVGPHGQREKEAGGAVLWVPVPCCSSSSPPTVLS